MAETPSDQVSSIIANIKESQKSEEITTTTIKSKRVKSSEKQIVDIPKGKPKSGRFWKAGRERFSSVNKTKGLKQDFKKKTALRLELQRTKQLARQALEELKQKEVLRKERRRENIKRSEQNRQKAEIVQVITNPAKIKRMKKKQLRFIQKRDTNKEVEANK